MESKSYLHSTRLTRFKFTLTPCKRKIISDMYYAASTRTRIRAVRCSSYWQNVELPFLYLFIAGHVHRLYRKGIFRRWHTIRAYTIQPRSTPFQ